MVKNPLFRLQRATLGFTLVELLVVIGIISLLIAILLPALGKAKESSNRVKCAANLRTIGQAAHAFASEHRGIYPVAYHMPDPTYPYWFPPLISMDDTLMDQDNWKTYGVPMQVFANYGAPETAWQCPSAQTSLRQINYTTGGLAAWGPCVWTNYMYVAGITTANLGKSVQKWKECIPSVAINDQDSTQRVIAADMVFFTGGASYDWDKAHARYDFNHRRTNADRLTVPAFQNILYGDGHVDGKGSTWFPSALSVSTNYSLVQAGNSVGGYFYWGRYQDGGVAADPPVPPTTPTTPTTPSTPSVPSVPAPPPPKPIVPTPLPS